MADKTFYEFVVLPVGTPTVNGRIYPKELIEQQMAKYKERFIDENGALVTLHSDGGEVMLKDAVGVVKELRIGIHGHLLAKVELLNTDACNSLLSENGKFDFTKYDVTPFGIGSLKDKVVQEDYEISGFYITKKENE